MNNVELAADSNIEIVPTADIVLSTGGKAEITTEVDNSLALTATKKEYKIVGDEVYIAKLYEDAPQWMKDLVQLVVDNTMASESTALLNSLVSQLNQFATSYVPLNTYTQSIIDLSNADTAMHGTLETLNSNFNDGLNNANSQIINLQSTKASKDEVATKVVETLTAQLLTPTSELGATIANLQQAIVTGDSANADSVTTLMSTLEGEVDARATAVSALNTRVTSTETAITAQATDITALTTEVNNGTNTWSAADSTLENSLHTEINAEGARVESKFAYNSSLKLNGVTYNSGFGLSNSTGTGIGSEFWIDASRLKFTNSAKTGSKAPFTIDTSGDTPQITFNGKVSFSDVTEAPTVTQHSTFPGVNIGTGYTVTKAGAHVIYLYSTGATGLIIKANSTPIGTIASLNKQVLVFATPALPAGSVVTITANGTVVAYISNPDEIKATAPGTQWYIPAYSTTLVAGSNGQFVIGSSSATGDIIKGINGTTNTTTIDGGKITAISITADQIAANTVTADRLTSTTGQSSVWTGGGLVSQNFDGNVVGDIGSPTKGFRLSSNAAGTSVDPNVYGGYIKGGTIDGATLIGGVLSVSDFKVKAQSYPANTGRFQLEFETVTKGMSTIDSPVFIGQAASPGHSLSRMCLDSQIFRYYASCDAFFTTNTTTVYVSVNGGAWTVVATATSTQGSGVAGTYVHTNSGSDTVQFRFTTTSGSDMSHAVNRFRVVSDNFI